MMDDDVVNLSDLGTFAVVRFAAYALFALAILTSCTSIFPKHVDSAEAACANLDWYEIGRSDGAIGADSLKEHQDRCNKTTHPFEAEMYMNGRNEGLVDFCSAAGGLQAGRSGLTYQKVCPENLEKPFLANFQLGAKIHKLEEENSELESRIATLKDLMNPLQSRSSVNGQIERLQNRRDLNFTAISNLESQIPEEKASN